MIRLALASAAAVFLCAFAFPYAEASSECPTLTQARRAHPGVYLSWSRNHCWHPGHSKGDKLLPVGRREQRERQVAADEPPRPRPVRLALSAPTPEPVAPVRQVLLAPLRVEDRTSIPVWQLIDDMTEKPSPPPTVAWWTPLVSRGVILVGGARLYAH